MPMRPPADQGAKVRQDRIVEKHHVDRLHQGPQEQHGKGHEGQFGAVVLPHLRGVAAEQVNDTAHIVDQTDLNRRDKDRHHPGEDKDLFKRLRIVPQKGPKPLRRVILFAIGNIGIYEVFEKSEHGEALEINGKMIGDARWQSRKGAMVMPA